MSARCCRHSIRGGHLQVEQYTYQKCQNMHTSDEGEHCESKQLQLSRSYPETQRSTLPVPPCWSLAQGLAQARLAAGGGRPRGAWRWRVRAPERHTAQGLVQAQLATGGGERQLAQPSSASRRRGFTNKTSCKTQLPETEAGMQGRLTRHRCDAQVALRPGHHYLIRALLCENARSDMALLCKLTPGRQAVHAAAGQLTGASS